MNNDLVNCLHYIEIFYYHLTIYILLLLLGTSDLICLKTFLAVLLARSDFNWVSFQLNLLSPY
jgi:hypothetical protein